MEGFEQALAACLPVLERFVKFKISDRLDAEDLFQDCCVTAVQKRESLRDLSSLKPWLLRIAQNKCTDYYRAKAKQLELPIEELSESVASVGLYGRTVDTAVSETLDKLGDREKQILYLYYFKDLPQDQIAARLHLPLGTVKSRLHYAKTCGNRS